MPDQNQTTPSADERWDVVAINIKTGSRRLLDTNKTASNADAIVMMAVLRIGVETEFFKMVPHGSEADEC